MSSAGQAACLTLGLGRCRPAVPGDGQPGRQRRQVLTTAQRSGSGGAHRRSGSCYFGERQRAGHPPEEHVSIFEKFHRLDAGDVRETYGYGLGLYLSRRLVEVMGGRIWVESEPGHGATFRIALPLAAAPA